MGYIYTVLLDQHKYYVFTSKDANIRLNTYNNTLEWLKAYRPLKILNIQQGDSEEPYIYKLMLEKGIYNVRSSMYPDMILNDTCIKQINAKIYKCNRCGGNHLIRDCKISVKDNTLDIYVNSASNDGCCTLL